MGKLVAVMGLAVVIAWAAGDARAESFRFEVSEDSWVNQANPDVVYGNNTYLSVKDRSGAAECYLKFSDSDLDRLTGYRINSASLWLYQYQATYSPGDSIYLRPVKGAWDEGSVSWNSRPLATTENAAAMMLHEGNERWREFSGLSSVVSQWRDVANYGLMLENNHDGIDGELFARFYSSEYLPDWRPYLSVDAVKTAPEPVSALLFSLGGAALCALKRKRAAR